MPWKIFSIAIYGATLVMLYGISTLYHSIRGRAKGVLRKLDHLSIYLLIAGTYTPFCLITLRGPWGWSLFGIVWDAGHCRHAAGDQATLGSADHVAGDLRVDGLGRSWSPSSPCSPIWVRQVSSGWPRVGCFTRWELFSSPLMSAIGTGTASGIFSSLPAA